MIFGLCHHIMMLLRRAFHQAMNSLEETVSLTIAVESLGSLLISITLALTALLPPRKVPK